MIKNYLTYIKEQNHILDPYGEDDWEDDNKDKTETCPGCGGDGYTVNVRIHPICCGMGYYQNGYCCNNPIPGEEPEPCPYCAGTGKIKTEEQ